MSQIHLKILTFNIELQQVNLKQWNFNKWILKKLEGGPLPPKMRLRHETYAAAWYPPKSKISPIDSEDETSKLEFETTKVVCGTQKRVQKSY